MILAMVSGILADKLVQPTHAGEERLRGRRRAEAKPRRRPPAAPAGPEPIGPLLAAASVDAGKDDTKVCTACHTFDKGQPNRIGPNLYGIVGDEIARAIAAAMTSPRR